MNWISPRSSSLLKAMTPVGRREQMAGEQRDAFALRMVAEEIAGDADPGAAGAVTFRKGVTPWPPFRRLV